MRLSELEPVWLTLDVFRFRCPHCRNVWLLCKRVVLGFKDQVRLVNSHLQREAEDDWDWPIDFVPMKKETCWTFVGNNFDLLTVTPSIDASASGHWHGHIRHGEIV